VTEKNNSRVDCAEADKKTVQAQRYEGRGFLAAGDSAPAELAVINYQVKPDRFLLSFLPFFFLSISQIPQIFTFKFKTLPFGCGVAVARALKPWQIGIVAI